MTVAKKSGAEAKKAIESKIAYASQQKKQLRTVTSKLGFAVTYSKDTLTARAQTTDASSTSSNVTGMDYTEDELSTVRDYSIVKIEPRNLLQGTLRLTRSCHS